MYSFLHQKGEPQCQGKHGNPHKVHWHFPFQATKVELRPIAKWNECFPLHFETADLKGIVTRTKELILPKGVIEKKAEESGVLSKNFHVYFSIKFHEIKLSVRRCQANPTQNSKKMLNDSFFYSVRTLWKKMQLILFNYVCIWFVRHRS